MRLLYIKNISESKGISIRSIAEQIDMSEQNLHRCIRVNQIQAHQLEIIAKILTTPVGYFFDEEDIHNNSQRIEGDNNVVVGRDNNGNGNIERLQDCRKEVAHLNAMLKEKETIIAEKERTIQILMNKK